MDTVLPASSKSKAPPIEFRFLESVAGEILGNSDVATVTAMTLQRMGLDAGRIGALVARCGSPAKSGAFEFKKIEADRDTPENFGLLVRRRNPKAEVRSGRSAQVS